jgi:hypothetical protein
MEHFIGPAYIRPHLRPQGAIMKLNRREAIGGSIAAAIAGLTWQARGMTYEQLRAIGGRFAGASFWGDRYHVEALRMPDGYLRYFNVAGEFPDKVLHETTREDFESRWEHRRGGSGIPHYKEQTQCDGSQSS